MAVVDDGGVVPDWPTETSPRGPVALPPCLAGAFVTMMVSKLSCDLDYNLCARLASAHWRHQANQANQSIQANSLMQRPVHHHKVDPPGLGQRQGSRQSQPLDSHGCIAIGFARSSVRNGKVSPVPCVTSSTSVDPLQGLERQTLKRSSP
jgi:hypothetical protein